MEPRARHTFIYDSAIVLSFKQGQNLNKKKRTVGQNHSYYSMILILPRDRAMLSSVSRMLATDYSELRSYLYQLSVNRVASCPRFQLLFDGSLLLRPE